LRACAGRKRELDGELFAAGRETRYGPAVLPDASMRAHRLGLGALLCLVCALSSACTQKGANSGSARSAVPAPAASATAPRYVAPDADGWGRAGELHFLELIEGSAPRSQQLPMVVLLHGMGDRPHEGWLEGFELHVPLRVIMPQAPIPHYQGFSWFDYDVRGNNPPEPLARGIARAAELLAELLALVPAHRATTGLPLVAGFSQGGILSYALALRQPDRLRFALPIAGLLPEPLWPVQAPQGKRPPIRALHGARDAVVPTEGARALTQRLRELGYDAQLEEFAGVGHTISPDMQRRVNALLQAGLAL
jgi:phospholipase/carboxylesterase